LKYPEFLDVSSISFLKQYHFYFIEIMGYLEFGRNHPLAITMIFLTILSIPAYALFFFFEIKIDILASILYSIIIAMLFCLAVIIIQFFKRTDAIIKIFIDNLGNIVKKKKYSISVTKITTYDFDKLIICFNYPISNYKNPKKIYSKGFYRGLDGIGNHFVSIGSEMYETLLENKFSFNFLIPKEKVKIEVPKYKMSEYAKDTLKQFQNWRYEYPSLAGIMEKLPNWIDRAEIFCEDEMVIVQVLVEKHFCLNNSLDVYNELVNIKRGLTEAQQNRL